MTRPGPVAGARTAGAESRAHVNAPRADRHLAGRDRDPEHAGALAAADEREGHRRLSPDADAGIGRSRACTPCPAEWPWSTTRTRGSDRDTRGRPRPRRPRAGDRRRPDPRREADQTRP